MRIAITGARGFIGSALSRCLSAAGHTVIHWVRHPHQANERRFVMPDAIDPGLFAEAPDWIVHAAYVTQFRSAEKTWAANWAGSLRLFELAQKQGSKILFLSSLSAHPDALSIYGRSKYQLESALDLNQHLVIKPGLVIGPGGLFLRMLRLLQRLKFAVLFWGGRQPLYTIAIEDLLQACLGLIAQNAVGRYHVMEPAAYPMTDFYRLCMQALGLRPRMLPLPGDISLATLKWLEKMRLHLPISSENLLGLQQACFFDSDCDKIGLSPLPLVQALVPICGNLGNLRSQHHPKDTQRTGR